MSQLSEQIDRAQLIACKTSELSQIAGIKKHVLRRYERIGLLRGQVTSTATTGQHAYTRDDLVCLERVAFMQMIGMSRAEIKGIVSSERAEVVSDLRLQLELLSEKRKRLDRLIYFLQFAEEVNRRNDPDDWHHLGKVIESIKFAEDRQSLKKRYMQKCQTAADGSVGESE